MDDESADDAAFRAEARAWLAEHAPAYRSPGGPSLVFADVSDTGHVVRGQAWQRELAAGGWVGLGWPVEHGGRGLPVAHRVIWAQEAAAAGAPPGINLVGEAMVGPTLMAHGTESQQCRYLPPILAADEIWCQLFSEPDAGTDLAAVTTTAVASEDGDGWVVTGHKLWTSAAHYADWGILLARTDWDVPKHQGCTYFLVDMRAPGITVRPVRQMTGGAAFDEVLLDGVRVPDTCRVGAVGEGWAVAVTTLSAERLHLGLGAARVAGTVERMLAEVRRAGRGRRPRCPPGGGPGVDRRQGAGGAGRAGGGSDGRRGCSGAEGAVARLASIRLSRRTDELLDAMRGADAMLVDDWTLHQLWIPATRIGGGTEEALRSIVAERVLGLPKSPRRVCRTGDTFRPNTAVRVTGSPEGRGARGSMSSILLVEDDASVREAVTMALEGDGHRVSTAAAGDEAIERWRQVQPDLVLLDVMLPVIDGFEVCRRIRAVDQVPIILLTAKADPIDVVVGLESGADDYVTKPFETRVLLARVKAVLRRQTRQPEERTMRFGDLAVDPLGHGRHPPGPGGEAEPHRAQAAAGAGPPPGAGLHPGPPPRAGVGVLLPGRLPAGRRLRAAPAVEGGGRPRQPHAHPDRPGGGVQAGGAP